MGLAPGVPVGQMFCSECGRSFPAEDLARFGANAVCAECKPRFVQRMQEGAPVHAAVVYGGFWRRFAAVFLDGIIMAIVTFPVNLAVGFMSSSGANNRSPTDPSAALGMVGVAYAVSLTLNLAYYVYFLTKKGATPGKMVMGLRVVTASGGPISAGRAVGRFFAQLLSGLILGIGYIMAAFDQEKRALHDHICGTRVVRQT